MSEAADSQIGLRQILASLANPLLLLSTDGRILAANPAAARLIGMPNQELESRSLQEFCVSPERLEPMLKRWARTTQRTPGSLLIKAAGEDAPVSCNCSGAAIQHLGAACILLECLKREQHVSQFLVLNQRIEELRKELSARMLLDEERSRLLAAERLAREASEDASRLKDEFIGLVSHELRTPLTTITGNSRLLRAYKDVLSREQAATALEDIGEAAERLRKIIENMLMLARMETSDAPLQDETRLQDMVTAAVQAFRKSHPQRRIILDLDENVPPVKQAPGASELVVENLLSNADKYSDQAEPIEVRLRQKGHEAVVAVADYGIGLTQEELERLFTPFYRSSRVRTTRGGIGLGLAVCKRLVEAQGGRIWAGPREQGAEFSFAFAIPGATEACGQPAPGHPPG